MLLQDVGFGRGSPLVRSTLEHAVAIWWLAGKRGAALLCLGHLLARGSVCEAISSAAFNIELRRAMGCHAVPPGARIVRIRPGRGAMSDVGAGTESQDVKVALLDAAGNTVQLYVQTVGNSISDGEAEVAGGHPGLEQAFGAIEAVGRRAADAIQAAAPDRFTIELGFEFKAEAGGLVAMLVRTGGSGSVHVTMEWDRIHAVPAVG